MLNPNLLQRLLDEFSVNTQFWGSGEAKTVNDLFSEIMYGESHLRIDGDGIVRVVEIVKMFIYNALLPQNGCLLEWGQYLPDGRYRERKQNPSGKIKRGESPEEALVREVEEELAISRHEYDLFALPSKLENKPSISYPGLSCLYIIHGFKINVANEATICRGDFTTIEENGTILIFKWENLLP